VSPTDRLRASFRKTEAFDFAFANQIPDGSGHIFDRDVRIDAMLIVQVDRVDLESAKRACSRLLDPFRAAVQLAPPLLEGWRASEFRADHHLPAEWSERLADQFFVHVWAVDLGGIEEGHPRSTAARMREIMSSWLGNGA